MLNSNLLIEDLMTNGSKQQLAETSPSSDSKKTAHSDGNSSDSGSSHKLSKQPKRQKKCSSQKKKSKSDAKSEQQFISGRAEYGEFRQRTTVSI